MLLCICLGIEWQRMSKYGKKKISGKQGAAECVSNNHILTSSFTVQDPWQQCEIHYISLARTNQNSSITQFIMQWFLCFQIFRHFEKQMPNNIRDVFRGDNYVYMYTF